MCSNITLNDRQKIIAKFPIKERKSSYKNLEEAVKDALKFSFRDINFRTLKEKSDCQKLVEELCEKPENVKNKCLEGLEQVKVLEIFESKYWEEEKEKKDQRPTITNYLIKRLEEAKFVQKFVEYFAEDIRDEENFDKWHHDTCELFLNVFKEYYTDAKYGKAQKIINMMFKHLYCMAFESPLPEFLPEQHFAHCHLTLDSFTLEWFYREVVEKWYNRKDAKNRGVQIHKGKFDSWSNLGYITTKYKYENYTKVKRDCKDCNNCRLIETDGKYFYHYMFFVTVIRKFFEKTSKQTDEQKRYDGKTPFQAEFDIWPDIQLHLTAEALFGQSIGQGEAIEELENKTRKKFKDFSEAQKNYRDLDRKTKGEILKKKIEIIQMLW